MTLNQPELFAMRCRTLQAHNYADLHWRIFVKASKLCERKPADVRNQIQKIAERVLARLIQRHPLRYGRR